MQDDAATQPPDSARVPRLVAGCDLDRCVQSPAEGFLLSRIDGCTPLTALRAIGALSPDDVDACMARWESEGVIDFGTAPKTRRKRKPGEIDPSDIDESLDLDVDTQRRILEFEANLGGADHELLGVESNADVKAVKRAYFKLSKEFHPDRFFRRQIGPYAGRLDAIFKRVLAAYELMSDPDLRAEMARSKTIAAASAPPSGLPKPQAAQAGPAQPPRKLTKLERLRARMPMRLPSSVLAERQQRAQQLYDESRRAAHRGRYTDAAAHRRLAIAFDPFEDRYREGFSDLRARAAADRAEAIMRELNAPDAGRAREASGKEAMRLFEDALVYKPFDAHLNRSAARCALHCGDLERALEFANTAVERDGERAESHTVLATVHNRRGDRGHAIKELDQAIALDPSDEEASELKRKLLGVGRSSGTGEKR